MRPLVALLHRVATAVCVTAGLVPLAEAAELGEIVVTAQKREQSLQDVSVAVTALSAERLESAHINNIEDLQWIVPSVYFGNDFNMAKLTIRGVGSNTSTTGSETGVAMHVDGAVVARAEAQLTSLFDLERVEVLRGPQGSLYGRNAVGGSINLITAKPTEQLDGYARVSYGDYEYVNLEGALSGPLGSDRILGRLAVKSENRDGYGENPVSGKDVDDLDRQMARAHLQFVVSDTFDILLSGEWYEQDDASRALKFRREAFPGVLRLTSGGCQPVVAGVPSPCTFAAEDRDLASELEPFTETETWAGTVTLTWQLSDTFALVSITNYRELETVIGQDLDLAATANRLATTGFNTTYQRRDVDSEQTSSELQLQFESDRVNGVLGVFYLDETQRPVDTVGFNAFFGQPPPLPDMLAVLANPALGAFPPISPTGLQIDGVNVPAVPIDPMFAAQLCNTAEYVSVDPANPPIPKRVCIHSDLGTEAYAIFGQVNINFGEAWTLKLGGRYSEEEVTASNPSIIYARNGLGPILLTTPDGTFNKRDFSDFTPEAGLSWRPNDSAMLYYTYSEGFKAGAGENAAPGAATNFVSIIVDPEELTNHEIGFKSTWLENRLAFNVAVYTYDLEGQQVNKTLSGGPAGFSTIFENAAKTTADGVELELFAAPTDQFRVSAAVSYLDSKYEDFLTKDPLDPRNVAGGTPAGDPATDFVPPSGVPDVQLAGNPTRNSPEWAGNLHAEYDFALPADAKLTLGGDISYKDDVYFTEFARLLEGQDAYTLFDAQIRYVSGDGRWSAELWGKNLSDEEIASSTFQLATARIIGVTYMPPRTYGLTVGYQF
jgi:iron complex outermembrane receptor protein